MHPKQADGAVTSKDKHSECNTKLAVEFNGKPNKYT